MIKRYFILGGNRQEIEDYDDDYDDDLDLDDFIDSSSRSRRGRGRRSKKKKEPKIKMVFYWELLSEKDYESVDEAQAALEEFTNSGYEEYQIVCTELVGSMKMTWENTKKGFSVAKIEDVKGKDKSGVTSY